MLKTIGVWMLLVILLSGCSDQGNAGNLVSQPKSEKPASQKAVAASWAFEFVTWNNHPYKMTSVTVTKVGKLLGEITTSSDEETSSYAGNFSNRYPVGTKLYEIPGVDTTEAIAVEIGPNRYLRAEFVK